MKQVLITGATSGIGEQLAIDYAKSGWQVFACGRNQAKLNELASQHQGISTFRFDVTDADAVKDAARLLSGQIDLLILNAGNCEYIDDPMRFDGSLFERIIKVNLISLGYCLEHYLPKIRKGGQLAIVSSSAAFLPFPRATAYGTTKAGASYLAKTLSIELARYNIDVSLVNPGFVKTPLTDKNGFEMPMRVSVDYASNAIIKGLEKRKREIHFPTKFTYILKLLAALPDPIWRYIANKMVRAQQAHS
ncbi:MAG: SDR family NAD(P)-dependent oxidoreductase [Alteromonadaceae bacterium]|nr:SDR family NAD(P)-dependent oxidoreductase [Alteromonadaceae bacterium]